MVDELWQEFVQARQRIDELEAQLAAQIEKNRELHISLNLINGWCADYVAQIQELKMQMAEAQATEIDPDWAQAPEWAQWAWLRPAWKTLEGVYLEWCFYENRPDWKPNDWGFVEGYRHTSGAWRKDSGQKASLLDMIHSRDALRHRPLTQPAQQTQFLESVLAEVYEWQKVTFPQATHHSKAAHLLAEARELAADPTSRKEMADVLMLLSGLALGQDISLADAVAAKMVTNRTRTWGKPNEQGYVEHVREQPAQEETHPDMIIDLHAEDDDPAYAMMDMAKRMIRFTDAEEEQSPAQPLPGYTAPYTPGEMEELLDAYGE